MKLAARLVLVVLGALGLLVAATTGRAAPCAGLTSAVGLAAAASEAPPPGVVAGVPPALRAEALALRAAVVAGSAPDASERGARLVEQAASVEDPLARSELLFHVGTSLALAAQESGDASARAEAVRAFGAAATVERVRGSARRLAWAELELSRLYAEVGRDEEALALARRALHQARLAGAPRALYQAEWQVGLVQRQQGDRLRARQSLAAAFEGVLELRQDLAFADPAAAAELGADADAIGFALVDLLLLEAAGAEGDAEQGLLASARDHLERIKAAELRDHFRDPCLDAQRKATPDEVPGAVVLYPVLLPDRVELIVSRNRRLERHRVGVPGPRLAAEARDFRALLEKRTTRQYVRPARRLYEWLIRPIERGLDAERGVTLVIVPDRVLRSIPFAALMDARTGQYLIERVPLAMTPVLTLTEPRAIDREQVTLLAAGLSESVEGFEALSETRTEVASLSRVFPGQVLLDADFQVDRFTAAVASNPYSIVHIASHGKFDADESKSFVLAHDGRLGMDALAEMVRTTRFRSEHPLELLTLSACETATGDDQAALGLAGVALRAGARSAVATLWTVDDRAAARLIEVFYAELARPGVSRAEALRRAQRDVLASAQHEHPGYWSAFLLISSWL